jgi:SnoaL-like domain
MDAVERLVAMEEIKSLKGRYQRAVDAGRWDEFEECLTEDFSVFEDGMSERIHGRDVVLEATRQGFEIRQKQGGWKHHMILPDIEITSETTAKGTWTITAFDGWYEDRYAKEGGRWKVQWTHVHLTETARQLLQERYAAGRTS